MKSYMRYRTITISVYDSNGEIIFVTDEIHVKMPHTELRLKENSNLGRKWDKFQIKALQSS